MSAITGISSSNPTAETPLNQPKAVLPEDLPRASSEAVDFLQSLEDEDFRYLQFEDNLVTVSDTGKELGEFVISVKPAVHKGIPCYMVHANSHGAIDNVPCGTSITAFVTNKLETLEQEHHEYVKLDNHPLDRKTFIVKQDGETVVNRIITQGEKLDVDVQRTVQNFSHDTMQGFISEGSNLLLQRMLIKKSIPENCVMISFDSDSNLCPVTYSPLIQRTQIVQETELAVLGIERTISSDLPTTWQTYFMKDGHMSSRVQVGSPVTMRLLVAPQPIEEDDDMEKPTFEKEDIVIDEDMEMYSKFLDRKEQLKNDHSVYMRHHPDLKALMGDFLQFLLLRKPDDVVAFAADYFAPFATRMPGPTAYLESAAPTPFPNSRSNSKIQFLARSNTEST